MKLKRTIAIGVGAVIGCHLYACSSTPDVVSTSPDTSAVAESKPLAHPQPAKVAGTNRTSEPITVAEPAPTIAVDARSPQRTTRLIGLFGELNDTAFTGPSADGGGNLSQITFATEGACIDPDVDRTGTWLAFASTMHRTASDIYIKSVTGKTQTQVTNDSGDDVMPAFSPDGKTISFASNRAGNWDIYTVTIDGGQTVQITNDPDHELHPSWSPDGRTLAYCKFGTQSQRWEIWTVDVNNPGVRNFLDYGLFPQWCPDPARSKILFQRAKQRGSRHYGVWTIDVVNGQAKFPTEIVSAANAALINPAWSPDGRQVVFVSVLDPERATEHSAGRPTQSDLWVVNIDGSQRTSLTSSSGGTFANFQPVWAADGSIYFVSDRSGADNVWSVTTSRWNDRAPIQTAGVSGSDDGGTGSHP